MTRRIVVATNNPKKLVELRRVVEAAELDVQILGLADFPVYPEPEETEKTFEGNAMLKAQAAALHTGVEAIADDSGITVEELNDMPGVRSARWAGPGCDDTANVELLLAQLDGVPTPRRAGQFVCALAHVTPGGKRRVFRGEMPGHVATAARGDNGFGYDPIFVPEGQDLTTAEMAAADKDAISHRGQAVRAFVDWLPTLPLVRVLLASSPRSKPLRISSSPKPTKPSTSPKITDATNSSSTTSPSSPPAKNIPITANARSPNITDHSNLFEQQLLKPHSPLFNHSLNSLSLSVHPCSPLLISSCS